MKKRKVTALDVFLYVCMLGLMAAIIFPLLHVLAVSLSSSSYVMAGKVSIFPKGITTKMYQLILEDGKFLRAYVNTVVYTALGTAIALITTAMGAYALSRRQLVGQKLYTALITFTMFFSGGLIPTFLTLKSYHMLDTIWAIVLPGAVSTWNLIIMRSFFVSYPKEIIESGMIDGLNDASVFFRLILPTSKAILATIGLYYAVGYWNSYLPALIYLNDSTKYPVQLLLRQMLVSAATQMNELSDTVIVEESLKYASIVVTALPIICVYPFIQKYFVKGTMVGSIKG